MRARRYRSGAPVRAPCVARGPSTLFSFGHARRPTIMRMTRLSAGGCEIVDDGRLPYYPYGIRNQKPCNIEAGVCAQRLRGGAAVVIGLADIRSTFPASAPLRAKRHPHSANRRGHLWFRRDVRHGVRHGPANPMRRAGRAAFVTGSPKLHSRNVSSTRGEGV